MRTMENAELSAGEIMAIATERNTAGDFPDLASMARQLTVSVQSSPDTDWATLVDRIEEDFAPDYDQEEYANPALNLMGLDEVDDVLEAIVDRGGPENQRLLDIGCGPGRIAIAAARQGVQVDAFDATKAYVQMTTAKAQLLGLESRVRAVVATAEAYDYPNSTYDQATAMFGVLNHVADWASVLPKLLKSLQSGGVFNGSYYGSSQATVFELMSAGKLSYDPSILVRRVDGGLQLGESADDVLPANFPSPLEIAERLDETGFDDVKLQGRLLFTSLYPKDPTPQNITAYLELLVELDPAVAKELEPLADQPQELLLAAYRADMAPEQQRQLDAFAYIGVTARKGALA